MSKNLFEFEVCNINTHINTLFSVHVNITFEFILTEKRCPCKPS